MAHIEPPGRRDWLEGYWHDVQSAVRSLRSAATLTSVVLVTLALGVGVNVAIFSVLDDTVLSPFPSLIVWRS
jgi:putative ABC transport system permease protein